MVGSLDDLNLRVFYRENATVYRPVSTVQLDGTTRQEMQPVEELTDIPCRLSMNTKDDNLDREDDQNPVLEVCTLFCSPSWKIQEGDVLDVTRDEITQRWVAGAPTRYRHSLQVRVVRRGRA